MSIPTTEVGDVIAERYELLEHLGSGGFGAVYRARQIGMEREVAVKLMLSRASGTTAEARFRREARLAASLCSPHTVRLFDFGTMADERLFMAMELLRGRELEKAIEERALPLLEVRRIALGVLDSLAEAHAQGIIHRDLKPGNIFLAEVGRSRDFVKVLDFGIARSIDPSDQSQKLTAAGQSVGTPNYMAPEQIKGVDIGPHTDLYALGLVMLEMATGSVAVPGNGPIDTAIRQLSDDPVVIPPWLLVSPLGPVLERACAKPIELRYRDAETMLEDLEAIDPATLDADLDRSSGEWARSPATGRVSAPGVVTPGSIGLPGAQRDSGPVHSGTDSGELLYPSPTTPARGIPSQPLDRPRRRRAAWVLAFLVVATLVVGGVWIRMASRSASETADEVSAAAAQAESELAGAALAGAVWGGIAHSTSRSRWKPSPPARPAPDVVRGEDQLVLAVGGSSFRLVSVPEGAVATMDGRELGTTPLRAGLPETAAYGSITLRHPGYREVTVVLQHHARGTVAVALPPASDEATDEVENATPDEAMPPADAASVVAEPLPDDEKVEGRRRRHRDRTKRDESSSEKPAREHSHSRRKPSIAVD